MLSIMQQNKARLFANVGRGIFALIIATTAIANIITARVELPWNTVVFTEPLFDMGGFAWERDGLIVCGLLLLVIARALLRGKRQAWLLSVGLLAFSLLSAVISKSDRSAILLALCLLILLLLLAPVFTTHSDKRSLARGYSALGLSACSLWSYGLISTFWNPGIVPLLLILRSDMLFLLHLLTLLVLGYGVFEVLRPVRLRYSHRHNERPRVYEVIRRYGRLATVHFTLGRDKSYFWSETKRTILAYRVAHGVAIVLGDPIGPEEEHEGVLWAFLAFCTRQDWSVALYQASESMYCLCQRNGLHAFKIGEEAIVEVGAFTFAGKHGAPVRHAMARARRGNVSIQCWQGERLPSDVFADMERVSAEWLREHGATSQMGFSMGHFPADWSPDIMTVVAFDAQSNVQAFLTWTPLYAVNGWALDIMRRGKETVPGTMELLIVSSIEWARVRGYSRMSLGLIPLVNSGEYSEERAYDMHTREHVRTLRPFWERSAIFLHHRGMVLRSYRSLYAFKAKFHPIWEPRYLIVSDKYAMPFILLALVRIHSRGWRSTLKGAGEKMFGAFKLSMSKAFAILQRTGLARHEDVPGVKQQK